ncbi:MAG: hydrogenase maturation protease [Actinomycetota bacterium]|nr:hydrogenase maturation protease [Actinomycetota bacterium]MDA8168054.1 hydrogenase maturation protease [Actinomycetota bacterium]
MSTAGNAVPVFEPAAVPAPAGGTPPVAVIGVGNTLMGDDGVGISIIESLSQKPLGDDVELVYGGTAGMALMRYFLECDLVIVIDAIDAGAEPGAIFRFHPDEAGVTTLRSNNIHGMGVGYLLTSARMRGIEPEVVVLAVQVGDVRPNDCQLTPEVAAAAARVQKLVTGEVRHWRRNRCQKET